MTTRWRLTDGHDLRLRCWDEACVAHHLASNQTHRLSLGAGQVLELLLSQGSQSATELAEHFEDATAAEIEALLHELRPLLLVERCA